ncbi:MAG: hypothetical protein OXD50_14800 [Chloroflexi bacterium]|nr:hypothetical protein [Chloroflexota bacterium]
MKEHGHEPSQQAGEMAGVLAAVVAGGVTLVQPDGDTQRGPDDQIVRDEVTFEIAWQDADGRTGIETVALGLSEAGDQASNDPSPASVEPEPDPAKS